MTRVHDLIITIRTATSHDEAFLESTFLTALHNAIFGARGFWDETRERRQFREQLRLQDSCVVSEDGTDVGFYTAFSGQARFLLGTLCILPTHQSKGIGTEVMRRLMLGNERSQLPFVLYVLKTNPAAKRFYERLGFRIIGESQYHHEMRLETAQRLTCVRAAAP